MRASHGLSKYRWCRPTGLLLALLPVLPIASCVSDDPALPPAEDPVQPPVQLVDGEYSVVWTPAARSLTFLRGGEPLLSFRTDGLQLGSVPKLDPAASYDPYWLEYGGEVLSAAPPDGLTWHTVEKSSVLAHNSTELTIELRLQGGLLAILGIKRDPSTAGRFAVQLTPTAADSGRALAFVRLRPRADSREGFYGLGEWPDSVNHRDKVRPMQMEIDVLESASNENHVPVPLLIGTQGWGLFVQSRRVGLFDVAHKQPDLVEITYGTAEQSSSGLLFHLFGAPKPIDVLRHYYAVTGAPLLPAPWALGPWIWRNENKDQAQVLSDIAKIRQLDLATSAIWIDRPYATTVNSFDFEKKRFADPKAMVDAIHAAGLRLALWHTPYLEKGSPDLPEAMQKGYFPVKSGLLLNGWSEPLDFSNPKAVALWQKRLDSYIQLGIEGFKLDYGEDLVPALGASRNIWQLRDGSDERTAHYQYQLQYHQTYAQLLPKTGGFLLGRAGRWGDQQNVSVVWPGDMDASFTRHREPIKDGSKTVLGVGGLPATVIQGINLGASGFPFFGADTGGYRHSPPDKELYIRWFQQTALSTVMQVGDASSQPPWEFTGDNGRDTETLDLYRTFARLHLRLFPYEWTYAEQLKTTGRPIQRAVGLVYPELGQHPDDEYLFGDDLLVAPVVTRGATSRQVLLPPGDWVDYWDGTLYQGGGAGTTVTVAAPLSKLPLFVRAGAIVPLLRPTIDTLSPTTDPSVQSFAAQAGPLTVRMCPGPAATTFTLYDGTRLGQSERGKPLSLQLRPGTVFDSGATLEVLRASEPKQLLLDGKPLPKLTTGPDLEASSEGWLWQPTAGGTLLIKLPAKATEQTVTEK